jgi:thiosulfate/3-mercaptopyruvate sulfurtransferase
MTILDAAALAALRDPIIVDVRPEPEWRRDAIPGAVLMNVYDYFIPASDAAGIAQMATAAAAAFAALGIDGTRPVVWYEEATGMISPRGLWFQDLLGIGGGAILDGGIAAWRAAGFATAPGSGATAAIRPDTPPGPIPRGFQRGLTTDLAEVTSAAARGAVVLDVRRPSEHDGSFVHPCCARPGRIPGSVLLFWEDLLENGRYRSPADLAARFAAVGLEPEQEVITYCHRGARAATAAYALKRAGYDRVRVFVGSWHEWAATSLPAERG